MQPRLGPLIASPQEAPREGDGYYAAKPGFHADVVPSALYPERAGQQGPVFSVSLRGLTGLSSPPSSQ